MKIIFSKKNNREVIKLSKIRDIRGREILDSRGNPTVEVDVILECGIKATASVPSGASTGEREAVELRDGDTRYGGKGVLKAVNNINTVLRNLLIGMDTQKQEKIDRAMILLDGTDNKSKLGANAILGVSMATLKAAALYRNQELFDYVGQARSFPKPMMNILNGGVHADNNLDFQEYMIIPSASSMKERVRIGSEVFHALKSVLTSKGYSTSVGDEGGYAPDLKNNSEGFDLILEAIIKAGYKPGVDVNLAIDAAASEFYKDGKYRLKGEGKIFSTNELIEYYSQLVKKYPIISIEDPVDQNDWNGLKLMTSKLGKKIQIVGDDLFVTNIRYLQKAIDLKAGNAILIKLNQIGTITEAMKTINLANRKGYKTIISHRSGETEDTIIADLAVGLGIGQIKTGSLSRSERVAKYNRLMRIEEYIQRGK